MGNSLKGEYTRLITVRGMCAADFSKPNTASALLIASLHGELRHA